MASAIKRNEPAVEDTNSGSQELKVVKSKLQRKDDEFSMNLESNSK